MRASSRPCSADSHVWTSPEWSGKDVILMKRFFSKQIAGRPLIWWRALVIIMAILVLMAVAGFDGPYAHSANAWIRIGNFSTHRVVCMSSYQNKLYAGLTNLSVCSYNGSSWQNTGFHFSNGEPTSIITFNNQLYVGTYQSSTGTEVWRYNGSTWTQVNTDGFGNPFVEDCNALAVYNNELYAVAYNLIGKFQVYKYISGTTWNQVDTGSWDVNNTGLCAASFGGYLWIGTENTVTGTEIWRYNGTTWVQANIDGFGLGSTVDSTHSFCIHNNKLYCGVGYMARVLTWNSGTSWSQIGSTGLADPSNNSDVGTLSSYNNILYAATITPSGPGTQVCSWNGSNWIPENSSGFGDSNNMGSYASAVFNDHLYIGTAGSSAQVWRDTDTPIPYSIYLAEGSTAWMDSCSEYISIENPNSTAVSAKLTYMVQDSGLVTGPTVSMPANSQATVNPQDTVGRAHFSTKVECLEGKTISADRTMIWNAGPGEEAHCAVGVTAPAKTWYLPEGSSQWGFETWTLIQNPNSQVANVTLTYMTDTGESIPIAHQVPAGSRESFNMATDIGSRDASTMVTSDQPVIAERAMYRNNRREGHDSVGTTAPAADYYLAEGATGYDVGYITYILVQNPQSSPTDVQVTYQTQSGQVAGPSFQMNPNSRKTIRVNDQLPPNTDVSTSVHGSQPLIAERAMYWNNGTGEACHDSIGMASAHTNFYLPDGETTGGRETWTLIQNPNSQAVSVEVSYLTPSGAGNVTKTETIPANSRQTYNMMAHSGISGRAAIKVRCLTSGKKIMVERAMYWNSRGAGTDTIGGYSDN